MSIVKLTPFENKYLINDFHLKNIIVIKLPFYVLCVISVENGITLFLIFLFK